MLRAFWPNPPRRTIIIWAEEGAWCVSAQGTYKDKCRDPPRVGAVFIRVMILLSQAGRAGRNAAKAVMELGFYRE